MQNERYDGYLWKIKQAGRYVDDIAQKSLKVLFDPNVSISEKVYEWKSIFGVDKKQGG